MKVRFTTNIDHYRGLTWPALDYPPRKGERVSVHPESSHICGYKKIPTVLEVVQVTYYADEVLVELWYNEVEYKLYTQAGHKL